MRRNFKPGLVLASILALAASSARAEIRSLSQDWLFQRGDVEGAAAPGFDASGWRQVAAPHDFSIMDKPDGTPPFDRHAVSGQDSGYLPGGVGWYRRDLTLSAAEAAKVVRLNFEAVYMDAEIFLNGTSIGRQRFGYGAFSLDVTGKVKAGRNVVAVRVNHVDPSSRWYAGSGLIRPVALELLDPVHIAPGSVFVTTPKASAERGEVALHLTLANRSRKAQAVQLVSKVVGPDQRVAARTERTVSLAAQGATDLSETLEIARPALWSPASPSLYDLVQEVLVDGRVVDARRTRFGIRTITANAAEGLRINGEQVVLKGGNIHHDNYMLGAAGWPDADARKVALLKAAGYNAIRSSHNPASQATLDAADALGMLVIDEAFDAWTVGKRANDYAALFKDDWAKDIDALVISGRNHPSLLFWSIGNEIPEQGSPAGAATARMLAQRIRRLDPTRGITQAISVDAPKDTAATFAALDVGGYNYMPEAFARDHQAFPERVMYTAESTSKRAFAHWRPVETTPYVIGDFVWTAMDYIGEASIGFTGYSQDWKKIGPYPWNLAYSGEIDATGRKRPAAFYRQVLWKTGLDPIAAFVAQPKETEDLPDRQIYAAAPAKYDWSLDDVHESWTWPGQEGAPLDVVVYSEFPQVELLVNGKSLGRKTVGVETEYKARFIAPYSPGRLEAIGYQTDAKSAAGRCAPPARRRPSRRRPTAGAWRPTARTWPMSASPSSMRRASRSTPATATGR